MHNRAKWTLLIYMAGDNNLSSAGDNDLAEMRRVGSTPDVNVVVEFDHAGDQGSRRFHVQPGGVGERVELLGETDSGSPQTLIDFVIWAAREYPAERYALVLWNHGGGWEPAEVDRIARQVGASNYSSREAADRSATPLGRAFFRTTLETILSLPSSHDRAICSDDGSGHSLDTVELGNVLARVVQTLGQPIDLLGMDACLMSNLEVAYQARMYARYMVASEENEPNEGWPYDVILREIVDRPDQPTADLATHIVQSYVKSYVDRAAPQIVTQSALDLSRVEGLARPLDVLADALAGHLPDAAQQIWAAQRNATHFFHQTLWDLADFSEELQHKTVDEAVARAAAEVHAAVAAGPQNFVIDQAHHVGQIGGGGAAGTLRGLSFGGRSHSLADKFDRCGGLTIYLLPPLMPISRYYADLAFAKERRWLKMLQAYHNA